MRPELQPGAFSPPAPPPPRKGGELAEWTLRLPWPFPGLLPAPSWHLPSSLPGGEVACSPLLLMPLPSPPAGAALEPAAWPSHFPHRAQENPPPESHPPPQALLFRALGPSTPAAPAALLAGRVPSVVLPRGLCTGVLRPQAPCAHLRGPSRFFPSGGASLVLGSPLLPACFFAA